MIVQKADNTIVLPLLPNLYIFPFSFHQTLGVVRWTLTVSSGFSQKCIRLTYFVNHQKS